MIVVVVCWRWVGSNENSIVLLRNLKNHLNSVTCSGLIIALTSPMFWETIFLPFLDVKDIIEHIITENDMLAPIGTEYM